MKPDRLIKREDGKLYVQTRTDKRAGLESNRRIRQAELMKVGQRIIGPDEHADVAVSFQFPTLLDYLAARQHYADIFEALDEGGEAAIHAANRLALLLPEYVTSVRNRGRVAVSRQAGLAGPCHAMPCRAQPSPAKPCLTTKDHSASVGSDSQVGDSNGR